MIWKIWNANIVDHVWVRHGDLIHRQSNNTFSCEMGMRTHTLNLPHTCPQIGPQMDWRFYDKETIGNHSLIVVYCFKVWRIHTDALHKYLQFLQFLQCPHVWHLFVWLFESIPFPPHPVPNHVVGSKPPTPRFWKSQTIQTIRTEAEWLGWDQMGMCIVSHWGYLGISKPSNLVI